MSVVFGNSSGRIWGLVQRALGAAGFTGVPVHVAILDKGQRSVKGLNSGNRERGHVGPRPHGSEAGSCAVVR